MLVTWIAGLLAIVSCATSARADLRSDASAIQKALQTEGAIVTRLPPMFLEADQTKLLRPLASASAAGGDTCVTVMVIAARTTLFSAVSATDEESIDETMAHTIAEKDSRQTTSVEGFYSADACHDDVRTLERMTLRMRSARGSLEVLIARSPKALSALDVALLSRSQGATAPRGDPGRPLVPAPIAQRRKNATARAHEDGAGGVVELDMASGEAGTGEFVLKVGAGCHRFDLMAEVQEGQGVDLDAELRETESNALLAQDRGETPDARVESCIAKPLEVSVKFAGAPPHGRVFISDALFPLLPFVPEHWGSRATTAFSQLLRRRHTPPIRVAPMFETMGVQGSTQVSVTVEPDHCYAAGVSLIRGASRGVRLVASASSRSSTEEAPASADGASVVFCSEDRDTAHVVVDAPGAAIWWVLLIWPLGEATP